ncbi:MAG: bifunctional 5,10-methylenetetrahydrofolate dehydrogenase/5,10-methenyltetrahydrofolate cyclohydrolase [Bacilli bacterium]|jgi:methylenetetrahydrofolate dehydrogenase (NADP+)/methenyltetrahydrofolate cyclohydrolase
MEIKDYVSNRKEMIKRDIVSLVIKPHLVIIQVNDDDASNAYIKGKLKDAAEVNIDASLIKLSSNISEEELISLIKSKNADSSVHGLIVQMPLPQQIDENKIKLAIDPAKDVDGFHPQSLYDPCTPKGIINYLKEEKFDFSGKNAVVIGRSNIVGKPTAKLLLKENCNVTVLHSKTSFEDMNFYLAHADIIVVAIGKKWFLNNQILKSSAVVIDVGINREDGKLFGDAKPSLKVKLQTPVPGGVGLLTRITLIENLLEAYKNAI